MSPAIPSPHNPDMAYFYEENTSKIDEPGLPGIDRSGVCKNTCLTPSHLRAGMGVNGSLEPDC